MTEFVILSRADILTLCDDKPVTVYVDKKPYVLCTDEYFEEQRNEPEESEVQEADNKYEAKVIIRGNCMMCGKELTEGLFFCKECEDKAKIRK